MSNLQKKNKDVQVFNNPDFGQVRTIGNAEKPMFCLADVCRALDLKNPSDVSTRLDQKGIVISEGVSTTTNQYGKRTEQYVNLIYVNEPNLYRCVFQSRKENALLFQDWIFNDVLPTIRKNGGYGVGSMSDDDAILYGYGKALEKINRQSTIIQRQSKQLQEFKRKSEENKVRQVAKLLENKTEELIRISDWIDSENDFERCEDVVSLNDLLRMCATFFLTNGYDGVKRKSVSKVLSEQGYKKIRRAKGIYFVLR